MASRPQGGRRDDLALTMRPVVVQVYAEISAAPQRLWELLTDWEHQGEWMREASDFEVVSPQRAGVGTTVATTVRIAGITTRDRIRVDIWQPPTGSAPAHLGIVHLGWVKGRADIHLTELPDERLRLDWTEQLHPPLALLGATAMRLLTPLLTHTFRRDLTLLRTLAEQT
ncbi:SRPBCC family protein [Nocardia sp. NBC_01499]|uniref:SRPBCC family protein n=1 Tax=Nocardia sp. NBC_01499 TaxID=2903597 RepID=UPI00386A4842